MTDIHIETPGVRGFTRATWHGVTSLRSMLLRLVKENPEGAREEMEALYIAEGKKKAMLIEESLRRCFSGDWDAVTGKPRRQRSEKEKAAAKAALTAAAAKRLKTIVLLDFILPDGKALRDSTGKECRQAGGWLTKVGERVGDKGVVGEKLNEAQLSKILASAK